MQVEPGAVSGMIGLHPRIFEAGHISQIGEFGQRRALVEKTGHGTAILRHDRGARRMAFNKGIGERSEKLCTHKAFDGGKCRAQRIVQRDAEVVAIDVETPAGIDCDHGAGGRWIKDRLCEKCLHHAATVLALRVMQARAVATSVNNAESGGRLLSRSISTGRRPPRAVTCAKRS